MELITSPIYIYSANKGNQAKALPNTANAGKQDGEELTIFRNVQFSSQSLPYVLECISFVSFGAIFQNSRSLEHIFCMRVYLCLVVATCFVRGRNHYFPPFANVIAKRAKCIGMHMFCSTSGEIPEISKS